MGSRDSVLRQPEHKLEGFKATLISTSYGPGFYGKRTSWGWHLGNGRDEDSWSVVRSTSVNVAFKYPINPMGAKFKWLGREVTLRVPLNGRYSGRPRRVFLASATKFAIVGAVIVDWVKGSDIDLQEPLVKILGFRRALSYGRREIEVTFRGVKHNSFEPVG